MSFNANDTVRAASDAGVTNYPGTGYAYVTIPSVPDPSKCGLSATVTSYSSRVTATAQVSSAATSSWPPETSLPGAFTAAPVDLTVTCAKYS